MKPNVHQQCKDDWKESLKIMVQIKMAEKESEFYKGMVNEEVQLTKKDKFII